MGDTRLLELAGLAAGEQYGPERNPLERDDLALRLAVKLGMCVTQFLRTSYPPHVMVGFKTGPDSGSNLTEDHDADPYAATRRAIVRAAAAMVQP